jgi:hypothetical protein
MIVGVRFALFVLSPVVMAGLDPAIYALAGYDIRLPEGVDHRVKPGDDDFQQRQSGVPQPISPNGTAVGDAGA